MKKKKTGRGIAFWIMFVMTVFGFLFLVQKLYQVYQSNQEAKKISTSYTEKVEDSGIVIKEAHPQSFNKVHAEKESVRKETRYADLPPIDGFNPKFDALKMHNSDCIGWIRFPTPDCISYPILWKKGDNAFYLHHDVNGHSDKNGSIFLDGENEPDFTDQNTLIYGHNMWNNVMFSRLSDYRSEEQWKKSPYFFIYRPDGMELVCRIYAATEIDDVDGVYQQTNFEDEETYAAYLKAWSERSLYKTDTHLDVHATSITLSTCIRQLQSDRRFIVQALVVEKRKYD